MVEWLRGVGYALWVFSGVAILGGLLYQLIFAPPSPTRARAVTEAILILAWGTVELLRRAKQRRRGGNLGAVEQEDAADEAREG